MLNLNKVVSSAAALAIGSLFVLTTGCNSSDDASNGISSNKSAHARVPAAPADDTAASASGNVIWGGITHEDGTAMSKDELNSDIAELPTLGVNYNELQSAVTADSASGIVTLYDANGNVIAMIPAAGYGTIRSVTTTASSMDEKGNCTNGSLVFDLNDTQQAVPAANSR
ncbi:unnamed protein product [Sphagnum jensenii]|uniref:Uncharacterized protein n=1 Tax=Sphagnum jensenii TaxID=128206 RepID=A0ABP0VEI6_9BRYO